MKNILRKNGIELTEYAHKLHAVYNYINNGDNLMFPLYLQFSDIKPQLVVYLHFYIAVKKFIQSKYTLNYKYCLSL